MAQYKRYRSWMLERVEQAVKMQKPNIADLWCSPERFMFSNIRKERIREDHSFTHIPTTAQMVLFTAMRNRQEYRGLDGLWHETNSAWWWPGTTIPVLWTTTEIKRISRKTHLYVLFGRGNLPNTKKQREYFSWLTLCELRMFLCFAISSRVAQAMEMSGQKGLTLSLCTGNLDYEGIWREPAHFKT